MYTYKFIDVDHNNWTGKPKENIESIIEEYASIGWRLLQVIPKAPTSSMTKFITKIIFEKKVNNDFYNHKSDLPFIDDEGFV